jgi:3-(3-hydroxy-phenyl)propionate hydroxylase
LKENMTSKPSDVAIIGLGPTGAALAALLGQLNVDTVVIDKATDIFPMPRAISFDHEVMRVVQNLGLADEIRSFTVPYPATEYHGIDGKLIARYESLPPPHPQGWPPGFMFKQPPFEKALRASLATYPSVTVSLGTTLESLSSNGEQVELAVLSSSGESDKIQARYAIGCDGGGSVVRKIMGSSFDSLDFDEPWLVVDVLVNENCLHKVPQTVVQYCNPRRPTTYVIGAGTHRRWEFMLLPGEIAEEMNREEAIWGLLSPWLTQQDGTVWRATTYVFHALVAQEWRNGRVLLAGDAAHMTPPFMAQGMCQGIRDAANLAWKLALVLRGLSSPALLDSYEEERRQHVRTTTETAKGLGRVICELDLKRAAERDAGMLAKNGDPPRVQYRQSLIPGLIDGALCTEQRSPVGMRFPQPRIIRKGSPELLDDVVGANFRLVILNDYRDSVPGLLRGHIENLGGTLLALSDCRSSQQVSNGDWLIVEADELLQAWFVEHALIAAIVRPDHYVMAVARGASEMEEMSAALKRCLHLQPEDLSSL